MKKFLIGLLVLCMVVIGVLGQVSLAPLGQGGLVDGHAHLVDDDAVGLVQEEYG